MPTNGFSTKPQKVKLLAGEQKATEASNTADGKLIAMEAFTGVPQLNHTAVLAGPVPFFLSQQPAFALNSHLVVSFFLGEHPLAAIQRCFGKKNAGRKPKPQLQDSIQARKNTPTPCAGASLSFCPTRPAGVGSADRQVVAVLQEPAAVQQEEARAAEARIHAGAFRSKIGSTDHKTLRGGGFGFRTYLRGAEGRGDGMVNPCLFLLVDQRGLRTGKLEAKLAT